MAERLYAVRKYADATQEDVAYLAGMSLSFYQSLEKGAGDNTDGHTLRPIAQLYGRTVDELFTLGPLPERTDPNYTQKVRRLLPEPMSPQNFEVARRLLEKHRQEVKELHVELARQKKQRARKGDRDGDEATHAERRSKREEAD